MLVTSLPRAIYAKYYNKVTAVIFLILSLIVGIYFLMAFLTCLNNGRSMNHWLRHTDHLSGPPASWATKNSLPNVDDYLSKQATSGLWGFVDSANDSWVIPAQFQAVSDRFRFDRAWAFSNQGFVLLNPRGEAVAIFEPTITVDLTIAGGMSRYSVIGRDGYPMYGFIRVVDGHVLPAEYHDAKWFVDGYALVGERTVTGMFLDQLGKKLGISFGVCWGSRLKMIDSSGRRKR